MKPPFKGKIKQADGQLRRSQVAMAYGPGSIVDLVDKSVVIACTDRWEGMERHPAIDEPRLRAAVCNQRRGQVPLDFSAPFRQAPPGDPEAPSRHVGIGAFEFPRWFVCQKCKSLKKLTDTERGAPGVRSHDGCGGNWLPVRFVAACRKGHLSDYPWSTFVHWGARACNDPQLEFIEGEVGDVTEMKVRCRGCGSQKELTDAQNRSLGIACKGKRVWMGEGEVDPAGCDEKNIDLIVRTASNAYFAQTMSALTLPDGRSVLRKAITPLADHVAGVYDTLDELRPMYPKLAAKFGLQAHSAETAWAEIEKIRSKELDTEPVRTAEYKYWMSAKGGPHNPPLDQAQPHAERIDSPHAMIDHVVLVKRVREVRALVGFTRLSPSIPDLQGTVRVEVAPVGNTNWLPCTEMLGEGVFFNLKEDAVAEWEQRPAVIAREQELLRGFQAWRDKLTEPLASPEFPGARFYLLHSLAHALMTSMALTCGYAASALRERIYCSDPNDKYKSAGILLVTGSAGSEGTLGGLVDEGRRLGDHFARAMEELRLCSGDPLCGKHGPMQAERYLLGAACHNCLLVSEPSCEWFNQRLDRALLFPTMGQDPACAFFGKP
jgi:Domain of unknown function (DUF1998)